MPDEAQKVVDDPTQDEEEIDIDSLPQCVREILYRVQPQCQRYVMEMLAEFQEITASAVIAELEKQNGEISAEQPAGIRVPVDSGDAKFDREDSVGSDEGESGSGIGSSREQERLLVGSAEVTRPVGTESCVGVTKRLANGKDRQGDRPDCTGSGNSRSQDAIGGVGATSGNPVDCEQLTATRITGPKSVEDECVLRCDEQTEGHDCPVSGDSPLSPSSVNTNAPEEDTDERSRYVAHGADAGMSNEDSPAEKQSP